MGSGAQFTRLVRAQGPQIRRVRVVALWFGGIGLATVVLAIRRFMRSGYDPEQIWSVLIGLLVVVATAALVARSFSAGVFVGGERWQFRGLLHNDESNRTEIVGFGFTDRMTFISPVRQLTVRFRYRDPVVVSCVAWQNFGRSLHYGTGEPSEFSKGQRELLEFLCAAARLSPAEAD